MSSIKRQAPAFLVSLAAMLLGAGAATADPGTVASKQAQAQQVLGQINQIDTSLSGAVEAYDLANVKLRAIQGDLRQNGFALNVARVSLVNAEHRLAQRLVALYTSTGYQDSSIAVLLGATSLNDLLDRVETVSSISQQDTQMIKTVTAFKIDVQRREQLLQSAHAQQAQVVAQRAAERARIVSQLAQRRALLSTIKGQIVQMQAAERVRQLQIAAQARQRLAVQPPPPPPPAGTVGVAAATPEGATVAPPPAHGGVVGIAMQYLGVPYVWGGATPSGFDCSGLVMYAFAQIGVSLPHSSYAQFAMGTPVSMSQLQPGDLVFFAGASHEGIYIGGGQFIHAPHTGDVVKISSLSGWYASTFSGGRRI